MIVALVYGGAGALLFDEEASPPLAGAALAAGLVALGLLVRHLRKPLEAGETSNLARIREVSGRVREDQRLDPPG